MADHRPVQRSPRWARPFSAGRLLTGRLLECCAALAVTVAGAWGFMALCLASVHAAGRIGWGLATLLWVWAAGSIAIGYAHRCRAGFRRVRERREWEKHYRALLVDAHRRRADVFAAPRLQTTNVERVCLEETTTTARPPNSTESQPVPEAELRWSGARADCLLAKLSVQSG